MAPLIRAPSDPPTIIRFVTTPQLMTLNHKKLLSSPLKSPVIMPVIMGATLQKTVSARTSKLCRNYSLWTHRSEGIGARSSKYCQRERSSASRATTRVMAQRLSASIALTYLPSQMSESEWLQWIHRSRPINLTMASVAISPKSTKLTSQLIWNLIILYHRPKMVLFPPSTSKWWVRIGRRLGISRLQERALRQDRPPQATPVTHRSTKKDMVTMGGPSRRPPQTQRPWHLSLNNTTISKKSPR